MSTKKLLKKPMLLMGSLIAVMVLSFIESGNKTVKAQSEILWCDYYDAPGELYDGCKALMEYTPCICENQC